jgi:hypothetical protein
MAWVEEGVGGWRRLIGTLSYQVSADPPRWQEDGAREAGAVLLDHGVSDCSAPKRTISGISFFSGLFVK